MEKMENFEMLLKKLTDINVLSTKITKVKAKYKYKKLNKKLC